MKCRHNLVSAVCLMLVLALLASCASNGDSNQPSPDVYKTAAQKYIDEGDYDSAIKTLEEGIAATNDKGLSALLEEVKAIQGDSSKNQDPEPSPSVDTAAMANALLTALDYDLTELGYNHALFMDMDGDGLKDLITYDSNYRLGWIRYWKDEQLYGKQYDGLVDNVGELWLCQDATTGEYGIDKYDYGGGPVQGGNDTIYYLSHEIHIRDLTFDNGNNFSINYLPVSEAEISAAHEQNRKVRQIFNEEDPAAQIAEIREELNAMLPVDQQRSSPGSESTGIANAMLTALEMELSKNQNCRAELIDLDGDGVNELLTQSFNDGYDNGQIHSWKNGLLQTKIMGGMVIGNSEWWLCQDKDTGELGAVWQHDGGGQFTGGTSYIYYLSHDTTITGRFFWDENAEPFLEIDGKKVTQEEYTEASTQNRKVKDLFVNADVKTVWTQLNGMLPVDQQRSLPLAESEPVDGPRDIHGVLYSDYNLSLFEGGYSDTTGSVLLSLTLQPNETEFYCELFWVHGELLETGLVSPGIPAQLSEGTTITLDIDGMAQSLQVLLEGDDIDPNPSLLYLYADQ